MNILYTARTSPWESQPSTEELKELGYSEFEQAKGGSKAPSVPIDGGIVFILTGVIIFGFLYSKKWKLSRS